SRLTIWKASAEEGNGTYGEIVTATGDELAIACGDGVLRIGELQPEGKRRLSARDYLNGTKLAIGGKFGV
ncbi:MAG TPA: hypothetical protein VGO43_05145, partial [Pyrinomonadaceae bacterium]|nr:hypothetical protein [Pyrinomonadaceae bacterium]